ncbi:winged helix-turn-helix transcriptional regulator [Wenxinia saemankumensis]|uniref:Two-component system, OmpR family, response regulator/two-component system, OmpR family, response regulator PhoP n=1 Tax=Wenxinia saemankumensis TaxID=1447782 RepID=A0A1M6BY28_9RHOB|nr:response regulator transcription factor [Wenxinia saemankumensis]SHI53378.1 two-component system, OmpR family, response regulator/two-component system, OmpR family, response regulator PhoP [Wenxinia saemankumensis]
MRFLVTTTTWAGETTANALERAGFPLSRAEDGADAADLARLVRHDAALIEADLPDMDAAALIRAIMRDAPDLPVLVSGARSERAAPLLAAGAAAAVAPEGAGAITARLVAAALRAQGHPPPRLALAGAVFDPVARRAQTNGEVIPLARLEYELLEHLALNAGRVVSRSALMDQLYGLDEAPNDRTLDVYIFEIRKKIAAAGGDPDRLRTVRGRGLVFTPLPETEGPRRRQKRERYADRMSRAA